MKPGEGDPLIDLEQEGGNVRDFLTILFKHKTKILTIFLASVLTAGVASFVMPPTYEAQSTLLVKIGREYIYRPEVSSGTQISVNPPNQEEIINSEIRILTSRGLIEKVVGTIGVDKLYPRLVKTYPDGITPVDMAVIQFEKKLTVEVVKKSNVIDVSYQHRDRVLAAKAVNLLVDFFLDKHLQVYNDPTSSFLEQQLEDYRKKLEGSEDGLQQFKQRNRVYALDEQRNLLLKQQIDLDSAYKETQNRIEELRHRLASLNEKARMIAEDPPLYTFSERDRILTDSKTRLLDLQIKEQELLTKYKASHPLVVNTRKEIQIAREFVREQEGDIKTAVRTGNLVYQEVEKERIKTEADMKAQEAKGLSLKRQLGHMEAEISKLDLTEKEFVDLKRGFAVSEKNYKNYVDRFEDARISDDMNRRRLANISIIQPAAVPVKPVKPRKALNLSLSLILGATIGLGFAFLSEHVAQGLTTPDMAEKKVQLTVLASIPLYDWSG
jgi:uncharacterized protein involved in exopolysaccharide biosynthesis